MSYYFTKTLESDFDDAVARTTEGLKGAGFGVLSDIDVSGTLKNKLDVDLYRYRILGACNPQMAYQALQTEDKIGTMLPCNVILQEREPGRVEVSAVDPRASMAGVDNPALGDVAGQVRDLLRGVIDDL